MCNCGKQTCCCSEKRVSVVGPKGPAGPKGKDGLTGPTGPTGPAGPIATIPVKNTVFVMKNGNDGTGLVERFDKPFLTIAAARAALAAFYTGGNAPSATNRIRVVVYSGHYIEPLIIANFVDWDLTDIVLETASGVIPTIYDNGNSCDTIIYGNAKILIGGTSTAQAAIYTVGASTNLRVFADSVTSTSSAAVGALSTNQGALTVTARLISTTIASTAINNNSGTLTVNGNVSSSNGGGGGSSVDTTGSGTTVINGNVTAVGGVINNAIGTTIIKGDLTTTAVAPCIYMVSGSLTHTGNSTSAGIVVEYYGGSLTINDSRIHCTTINTKAIDVNASAAPFILKDVVIITTGTGKSIDAAAPQTVINYGAVATVAKGGNITLLVGTVGNNKFIVDGSVI